MSGVPDLFDDSNLEAGVAPSAIAPEYLITPPNTQVTEKEGKTRKKRKHQKKNSLGGSPSKKQLVAAVAPVPASSSALGLTFGQLAEKYRNMEELKKWKERSEEEQRAAIKRATLELCFHNLTQEDKLTVHQSHLQDLEREKTTADKKLEDLKKRVKKLEEDKATTASTIQDLTNEKSKMEKIIEAKDANLTTSNDTISRLTRENDELKADQADGWAKKKKQVKGDAFQNGFRSYLKTFMAAVPDFDWTSYFGRSMCKWMAEFAVMEAATIAQKKIQLQAQLEKERMHPTGAESNNQNANDKAGQDAEDAA